MKADWLTERAQLTVENSRQLRRDLRRMLKKAAEMNDRCAQGVKTLREEWYLMRRLRANAGRGVRMNPERTG